MLPADASAQGNFPDKPIRLIVPQAPGSATDLLARSVAAEVETILNQKIIIENKPGAAFTIGLDLVAQGRARRLHARHGAGRRACDQPQHGREDALRRRCATSSRSRS